MEQSSTSQFKKTLLYGTILGFILVIYAFILHKAHLEKSTWLSYIQYAFNIAAIVAAILCYRNQFNGGYISYGKALGTGVLTIVWASIILAIYTYVLTKFIDVSILERTKDLALQKIENSGNEKQSEMMTSMFDFMISPGFMSVMTFLGNVIFGTIFSLIAAAFLKKDKDIFEETDRVV